MNSRCHFAAACTFAVSCVLACSNVEHATPGASAGSAGESLGGASAGGGMGGQGDSGGMEPTAGSASAGTNAGGSAGTDATGGSGQAAAGEAGAVGTDLPLLQNGGFDNGGLSPWQAVVVPDVRGIYTQYPTGGAAIDGKYEVSFWNGTTDFTADLHQLISGLTPGKYELKLYIAYGTGINAAYLYAVNCGPTDVRVDLPLDVGVATFSPVSIPSIDVTGDSCIVGLFADMNTGDWLNADAFVFDQLPTP